MLFTPAFLLLFPAIDPAFPRLTPNQAIAMGLVVACVGSASSSSAYWYRRIVALDVAAPLLRVSVPVAVAFSIVAFSVPARGLLATFGGILFFLAVLLGRRRGARAGGEGHGPGGLGRGAMVRQHTSRDGHPFAYRFQAGWVDRAVCAAGAGLVGLTGIGLGPLLTTVLTIRHELPLHLATATSVFVVAITVLGAAVTHSILPLQRDVALPWGLVAMMALAVLLGGQVTPRLARRIPERGMRRALIGMFLIVGALMLPRAVAM